MSEPEHDVIFLEPEPSGDGDEEYGRMWCPDDVWQEPGIVYLLATPLRQAAPEILAALIKAEAHIRKVSGDGETDLRTEMNAVIAKAQGVFHDQSE